MITDTEMLDWVIANILGEQESDLPAYRLAGAYMLGKGGREAIQMAMGVDSKAVN